jgi:antitoxin HicB
MTEKNLDYYMGLPYRVDVYPERGEGGYTAVIPDLPGCMTAADTLEELWDMVAEAKELWLEVALADGDYVPEPAPLEVEAYSGKFVVRLPRSLHRQLAWRADQEDTSLNQLVVMLLSEGMGRWAERERYPSTAAYPYARSEKSMTIHDQGEVVQPLSPEEGKRDG